MTLLASSTRALLLSCNILRSCVQHARLGVFVLLKATLFLPYVAILLHIKTSQQFLTPICIIFFCFVLANFHPSISGSILPTFQTTGGCENCNEFFEKSIKVSSILFVCALEKIHIHTCGLWSGRFANRYITKLECLRGD